MSKGARQQVPGKCVMGLVFLLVLSGLLVTVSACEDLGTETSISTDEDTEVAGATTVSASTTGTSAAEESTTEESVASNEGAASEEPAPSEDEGTPKSGTTPTWVFTTQPEPTMLNMDWTRYEEDDMRLVFSPGWIDDRWSTASGGQYRYADGQARVLVGFEGVRIALVAVRNASCGEVLIQLDGGPLNFIDLYGAPATSERVWTSPVLASGLHELEVYWTGNSSPVSNDDLVTFDAVDVIGTLVGY